LGSSASSGGSPSGIGSGASGSGSRAGDGRAAPDPFFRGDFFDFALADIMQREIWASRRPRASKFHVGKSTYK
jgi:hypothetical protein